MSCTKNKRKLLWITYLGDHKWSIAHVRKFMATSTEFIVDYNCDLCGCQNTRSFVSWSELLEAGLTNDQIEKASTTWGMSILNPEGI